MLRFVVALAVGALCSTALAAPRLGRVFVLATQDTRTSVLAIDIEQHNGHVVPAAPRVIGALDHARDAGLRGALDGDDVLVSASTGGRDRSFASTLWRVRGGQAQRLLDDVVYGSRPLVVGRHAYVQRGRAGLQRPGVMRDDELVVTELDLDSGTTRVAAQLVGQLAYPIGVDDAGALFVYAVTPQTPGDILAFDAHGRRNLGTIGVARDFQLRDGHVTYQRPSTPPTEVVRATSDAFDLVQRTTGFIVRTRAGEELAIDVPGARLEPVGISP